MAINYDIDWEVRPTGNKLTGSGFNITNPNAGLNYSYNSTYQTFNYTDLIYNINDAPNEQVITTSSGAGSFSSGSYYVGVRYVGLGASNQILATSQIAETLVFEQNTAVTRNRFLAQVNPYLDYVQQRQGLYAFRVVMDDTNNTPDVIDRNLLVGAIYLQPTRTAEFIQLTFNVLPTGVTFGA